MIARNVPSFESLLHFVTNAFAKWPQKRKNRRAASPLIEPLEDRLVPANPFDGQILIANAATNTSNPNFQGIVGVDPNSGDQSQLVSIPYSHMVNGQNKMVFPADVTESTDNSGTFYEALFVADLGDENSTDDGSGGIIKITYSSGGGFAPLLGSQLPINMTGSFTSTVIFMLRIMETAREASTTCTKSTQAEEAQRW